MKRYKSVDDYLASQEMWHDELVQLRKILNSTPLEETVKWGGPCYTFDGKLVVGLGAFKSFVGLWFYQGALLADPEGKLINAQEGKTKALRQWRFKSKREISARKIKAYVKEAIALQAQGREIKPDRNRPVVITEPLKSALAEDPQAGARFSTLSKGKQREYAAYIAEAKREQTRVNRLAKILPMIQAGVGLNDKYRHE